VTENVVNAVNFVGRRHPSLTKPLSLRTLPL